MTELSSPQKRALKDALQLLSAANISPDTFHTAHVEATNRRLEETYSDDGVDDAPQPSLTIEKASYIPPKALFFSPLCDAGRVSRKSRVSAVVEHPEGAVVEYPEAGRVEGESVAHIFNVNPSEQMYPRQNIQYSMGGAHGRYYSNCELLRDPDSGAPVKCQKETYSCNSTKICDFADIDHEYDIVPDIGNFCKPWSAEQEVFTKTLALFTALQTYGCAFRSEFANEQSSKICVSPSPTNSSASKDIQESDECDGQLVMMETSSGQTIIQCEHREKNRRAHLWLNGLSEYDLTYLRALFHNDTNAIAIIEEDAKKKGYGPLVPCTVMVPASAKRQFCSEWHRYPNGNLDRGELHKDIKCSVTFDIYVPVPDYRNRVRKVLIVCHNRHTHPRPAPVKTPPVYLKILTSLLLKLNWKLADATVRRIALDTGFMSALRSELGWSEIRDPVLSNLHPSFGNTDHVKRIIHDLREMHFPMGTGFIGVMELQKQHMNLDSQNRYVRLVEEINSNNETFRIVIFLNMDEFEIETWQDTAQRSLVVCRAFTTSQSANAHFELFKRIFSIVESDTKQPVRFRHIHGDGIETWVLDGHRGQAQGLGMFCQFLSKGNEAICENEGGRRVMDLDPYDHLKHNMRLCSVHIKRNIHDMGNAVAEEIKTIMLSLLTSEPLPDLPERLEKIRNGGKKAKDWLDDKINSKFALPGIHWALSKMPLHIWKASPSTTNNNEQAHRNVNRDGTHLTLLAGVMRGMQYDIRAFEGIEGIARTGIYVRDQMTTPHERISCSVARKTSSYKRRLETADEELKKIQTKIDSAVVSLSKAQREAGAEKLKGQIDGPAHRRLRKLNDELRKAREVTTRLSRQGSGTMSVSFDSAEQVLQSAYSHEQSTTFGISAPSSSFTSHKQSNTRQITLHPPSAEASLYVSGAPRHVPVDMTLQVATAPLYSTSSNSTISNVEAAEENIQTGDSSKRRRAAHDIGGTIGRSPKRQRTAALNSTGFDIHFYNPEGGKRNKWSKI